MPSIGRRVVVIAIGVVLAIHTALITIWIQPSNPFRDAVGGDHLYSYINNKVFPLEQSWSVFAPTPRRGGENVKVRAYYGKPGSKNGRVTEWFDITADEDQRIKYLVNPSRIHSATRRLGGNINAAMAKFSSQQKLLVRGSYVQESPDKLIERLKQVNRSGVAGAANIDAFATNQEMVTRFLSMYARARWGKDVTMIQYRVGHRTVPNFNVRREQKFLDVPYTYYVFGWRKVIGASKDAQAAFDGYVPRAPAKQLKPVDEASTPQEGR